MKSKKKLNVKNKICPLVIFPFIVGILTGVLIFAFKISASFVIDKSNEIYAFVRANPKYLPLLLIVAVVIGVIASLILKFAKECRGGGIPTAVASIRGLMPMKWVQGAFVLFGSALLTFFVGVPLGNEGPSVQMGAATGKGASNLFGKKNRAWERYNMTGGACSGFAIATGSPMSGVVFALEEAHRRFSPTLFLVAGVSVLGGTLTNKLLSTLFGVDTALFHISIDNVMPLKYLWTAVVIGVFCGLFSILFSVVYQSIRSRRKQNIEQKERFWRIGLIFFAVALLGFFCQDILGSGHAVVERIFERHIVWYIVVLAFVIRAAFMIFANNEGVSGGLFVPTLAFGAMIASVLAEGMIALGLVEEQYYAILIVVGMTSFLAASSRIPLTAMTFAAEGLCVATNIIPVIIGVVIAYFTAEISGKLSLADTVIEIRAHGARKGRDAIIVDTHMTVQKGAFASGMEIRDILWPPTCTVLSVDKKDKASHATAICEGDVLHLHYRTYDPDETIRLLSYILGEQQEDETTRKKIGKEGHVVPED